MRHQIPRPVVRFLLSPSALVVLLLIVKIVPAAASEPFNLSAANVEMPASGTGNSQYTVSNIPMTGGLTVSCTYSGPTTAAHLPTCTYGPLSRASVTQGQSVTGSILFYPYGSAIPVSRQRSRSVPPLTLALAGGLLLGLRFRRDALRTFLVVICAVVVLAALPGCGGSATNMTPGVYQYTLTATNAAQDSAVVVSTNTNISVTIP